MKRLFSNPDMFRVVAAVVIALGFLPVARTAAQDLVGHGKNLGVAPSRLQFPLEHPAFTFDLPNGWIVDHGNNDKSMLIASLRGRPEIGLLWISVPDVFSLEEYTKILPGLAHDQLDQQNLHDLELVGQGADKVNGIPYYFVIAKGKLKDRAMSVTFLGFVSEQGRAYLLEYALPAADGPTRMKDFQSVIGSISPVK